MAPKIHVYFVPGLAASPEIFEFIKLSEHFTCHFLEWLVPISPDETIEAYAQRMSQQVVEDNPVLVGVSFGGVMVQEMKNFLNPSKIIIISSIKNKYEMPTRMHLAKKTNAYKILPTFLLKDIEKYEKYAFTNGVKKRLQLYKKYFSMRDALYLPWSIKTIVHWEREKTDPEIVHIHGSDDFIFPIQFIENCIEIPKGTHIMILNKAPKINLILENILSGFVQKN